MAIMMGVGVEVAMVFETKKMNISCHICIQVEKDHRKEKVWKKLK
jgi:hypothetical protein